MYSIKPIPDKQWHAFLTSQPTCSFHQSQEWAEFKHSQGWKIFRCGIMNENGEIEAGSTFFQYTFSNGTSFLHIPGGPLLNYQNSATAEKQWECLKKFIEHIATKQPAISLSHIRVEPLLTQVPFYCKKFKKAPIDMLPRFTNIIDISKTEHEIFNGFHPHLQAAIKKAKSEFHISAKKISEKNVADFYSLYLKMHNRKPFLALQPLSFFLSLYRKCGAIIDCITAFHEKSLAAAAFVIRFGDTATNLFAASDKGYVGTSALVQWCAILSSKKSGAKKYDLYGVLPKKFTGDHPWKKMSIFKRKFGGSEIQYIGAYDWILDTQAYKGSPANQLG